MTIHFDNINKEESFIEYKGIKYYHGSKLLATISNINVESILIIHSITIGYLCQNLKEGDNKYSNFSKDHKYSWHFSIYKNDNYFGSSVAFIKPLVGKYTSPKYQFSTSPAGKDSKINFKIKNTETGITIFTAIFRPFPSCCGAAIFDHITMNTKEEIEGLTKEEIMMIQSDMLRYDSRSSIMCIAKKNTSYNEAMKMLGFKVIDTFKNRNGNNVLETLSLTHEGLESK